MEKRARNLSYLPSSFLPIGTFEQCILNARQKSATKIQTAWRGYRCRKAFHENKKALQETKAAIIIQRSVQEWLYRRKNEVNVLKPETGNVYQLQNIDEAKIIQLQERIDRWNEENDGHFENQQKLQLQLGTTQEQLKSFYEKASTSRRRTERCRALCAQIEAISSLLTDLPSLEMCDQADISVFQTAGARDARIARQRHKQQLKLHNAPWWRRFHLHTDNLLYM